MQFRITRGDKVTHDGMRLAAGTIVDLPEHVCKQLKKFGVVVVDPEPETAVVPTPQVKAAPKGAK